MFDAGNRSQPTTPLMQPVSPPLCKMTGASTCTPFTAPVRWMRNLTVTRPVTNVYSSASERTVIGTDESVDFKLEDPSISRFHCEIVIDEGGVRVRDLKSLNGTVLDGVAVLEAFLRVGSLVRLGKTVIRFELVAFGPKRHILKPNTSVSVVVRHLASQGVELKQLGQRGRIPATPVAEQRGDAPARSHMSM